MQQTDSFYMRISPREKAMLHDVAKHFQRSQANMVRILILEKHRAVIAETANGKNTSKETTDASQTRL